MVSTNTNLLHLCHCRLKLLTLIQSCLLHFEVFLSFPFYRWKSLSFNYGCFSLLDFFFVLFIWIQLHLWLYQSESFRIFYKNLQYFCFINQDGKTNWKSFLALISQMICYFFSSSSSFYCCFNPFHLIWLIQFIYSMTLPSIICTNNIIIFNENYHKQGRSRKDNVKK